MEVIVRVCFFRLSNVNYSELHRLRRSSELSWTWIKNKQQCRLDSFRVSPWHIAKTNSESLGFRLICRCLARAVAQYSVRANISVFVYKWGVLKTLLYNCCRASCALANLEERRGTECFENKKTQSRSSKSKVSPLLPIAEYTIYIHLSVNVFFCVVTEKHSPFTITSANTTVLLLQGVEMHQNVSAGIILTDQSLVLQSVTRASAGDYTCLAANTEGKGTSNPVTLRIRCKYMPYW